MTAGMTAFPTSYSTSTAWSPPRWGRRRMSGPMANTSR